MVEGEIKCSICSAETLSGSKMDFVGLNICQDCHGELSLDKMGSSDPLPYLSDILDKKGMEIINDVSSLIARTPKETGWKVLGMAPFIGEQVTEEVQRGIMESALIIMGSSIVISGNDDQEDKDLTNKLVTLLLVIGQYVDLSVMGKISSTMGLSQGNRIHELTLMEEHDHSLFKMLRNIDHNEDPDKMSVVARAMTMLLR